MVGGLTVGVMGYFVPEVMGVGYNHVDKVLNGDVVLKLVVLFAVLKIVATAVCYASGNAGGIFGPALFIGAMMGASVGSVAHTLFPQYTAGPGAYALVGMGTAFAGIVRTPLTSVIMIFEVTRDYNIIVPLMISNLIAFFISYRLQKEPIYEALAHQDGVHLPTANSRSGDERIQVRQAMRAAPPLLPPDEEIDMALSQVRDSPFEAWPVGGKDGLWGMVKGVDLERAALSVPHDTLADFLAATFPGKPPDAEHLPHVHPDHSLSLALERMGSTGLNALAGGQPGQRARVDGNRAAGRHPGRVRRRQAGKERGATDMTPTASARQFLRTLAMVALAMFVLFAVDTFLAKTEEAESRIEAARLFKEGQRLLDQSRNAEAVERLKDALTIQRDNHDYQLALARRSWQRGSSPTRKLR